MLIIEESSKAEALKKLRESIEISVKYSRHDSLLPKNLSTTSHELLEKNIY